jgi:hypothetical protein
MSERNGDKARFQKNRKRKLHHRQRIRALMAGVPKRTGEETGAGDRRGTITVTDTASRAASLAMQDEGGPTRTGD